MAETLDVNSIPEQINRTEALRNALLKILWRRMEEYGTSMVNDDELLQIDLSHRYRMAVEVRLGEKSILNRAMERVNAWVIEPSAKRLKTR